MPAAASMIEAHENRIQDLETSHGEVAVALATNTNDLEHLQATVVEQIVPTLKAISDDVASGREENRKWFASTDGRLTTLETIRKTEEAKRLEDAANRKVWIARLTAPVLLILGGVAGAVASKFGEALWAYLTA